MRAATPYTYLEPNTFVQTTNGYQGTIVETIESKDQFGEPINVFRVKLTKRYEQKQYRKMDKEKTRNMNYSFIQY